ncbi:MAG TPA: hypothetical protein VF037_06470 [Gemmatimonadales bacterium]
MPRVVPLVLLLLTFLAPSRTAAQGASSVMLRPAAFVLEPGNASLITIRPILSPSASRERLRNAVIGGVVGAAAGAVVCTVISNIADDAAEDRFTTCTAKGYLLTGGIGFALGFGVGWVI